MAQNATAGSNDMNRAQAGIYVDPAAAQRVIERLRTEGVPPHFIGVLARDTKVEGYDGGEVATGAATGAVAGGILGGVAGLLVGAGALAIPGLGPVIAGGALATAMGVGVGTAAVGAGLGLATGGLVGALVGIGFSHEDASYLDREVRAGRTVVTVHGGHDASQAIQETGGQFYPGPPKSEEAPPFV